MRDSSVNILFQFLRAALGNEVAVGELSSDIDWQEVIDLSFEQGVAAIAVDDLQECLPLTPPEGKETQGGESLGSTGSPTENEGLLALDSPELEDLKYEWFGEVFAREECLTLKKVDSQKSQICINYTQGNRSCTSMR